MAAPSSHPRRRSYSKATDSRVAPLRPLQLKKSETFPATTSGASFGLKDLVIEYLLPPRSPTNTDALEELVQDVEIGRFSTSMRPCIARNAGFQTIGTVTGSSSVAVAPHACSIGSTHLFTHIKPPTSGISDCNSDSGLGTSVNSSTLNDDCAPTRRTNPTSTCAAITRSHTSVGTSDDKRCLGQYACQQIHDGIVRPVLEEEAFADFHPLMHDISRRIDEKSITNLRDLEKTLVFGAPEFSTTPKAYRRFSERSLQLLHAVVAYLPEQDQRLPSDRPYTNKYFAKVMGQIRLYTAMMAATREKEAKGEDVDEMDLSLDDDPSCPDEGDRTSFPTEQVLKPIESFEPPSRAHLVVEHFAVKRSSSNEDADDSVRRSAAQRRKVSVSDAAAFACEDCTKSFQRQCDLNKHRRAHARQWKCINAQCRYHSLGFPTEKERDRHFQDVHSDAPPQFKCVFDSCSYASKRESNCKQHMEKAHGWNYIRTKGNGRRKATSAKGPGTSTGQAPTAEPLRRPLRTPLMPTVPSPVPTLFHDPTARPDSDTLSPYFDGPTGVGQIPFSVHKDGFVFDETSGQPPAPVESSWFDEAFISNGSSFGLGGAFAARDSNPAMETPNTRSPTPALSNDILHATATSPMTSYRGESPGIACASLWDQPVPHWSCPGMHLDEGFEDTMQKTAGCATDFPLFEIPAASSAGDVCGQFLGPVVAENLDQYIPYELDDAVLDSIL